MFAIIKTGGKQYTVKEDDIITVEKLDAEIGDTVVFDEVLMINEDENTKFGTPFINGAKVEAEVEEQGKGKKVIVFKYRSKKNYRKKRGHRQLFTKVRIKSIES